MIPLLTLLCRHDERVLHALVLRRRPRLDCFMRSVTHLGDTGVILPIALLLWAGWLPAPEAAAGAAALAVLVLSHAWVQLLKRTISRPRPRLPVGCQSLAVSYTHLTLPTN